jgi:hypothetical protein
MIDSYKNKTFLVALNLLIIDIVVFLISVFMLDFRDAAISALLGGSLFVQLMNVVLIEKTRGERNDRQQK